MPSFLSLEDAVSGAGRETAQEPVRGNAEQRHVWRTAGGRKGADLDQKRPENKTRACER